MKKTPMLLLAVVLTLAGSAGAAKLPELKAEYKAKINQSIGADFLKKGATVPKVLVFYRCDGFVHGDAIVCCNEAFRDAAAKTGAFKPVFSDDIEMLKPESLAKFDVLVMNNCTSLSAKKFPFLAYSISDFCAAGKGIVSLHAGVDTLSDAPAASNCMGGLFGGHPWGSGGTWSFEVTDPACPVNAAFKGEVKFKLSDEIYQHKEPAFNPAKIRCLIKLDFSDPEVAGRDGKIRPDSKFYPVSWLRPFGKGRVFYTSFGHDSRAWCNEKVLRHMFDGYLYAAGMLKCDDTPDGLDVERIKAAKSVSEAEMLLREVLSHGGTEKIVADAVAKGRALLADPAVSAEVKAGVKKALRGFGLKPETMAYGTVKDAVPAMQKVAAAVEAMAKSPAAFAKLVASDDVNIRLAAVHNSKAVPVAELVKAYAAADNKVKAAILTALANRGAKEGAPLAAGELANEDEDLAVAAAYSLSKNGTAAEMPAAVKAIKRGGRVGRNAEYAVQDMPDPAATVKLFELAKADRELLKMAARRADDKQLALWQPLIASEDAEMRKAAWRAVSRQLSDKTLPAALKWFEGGIKESDKSVAAAALKAAAKWASDEDVAKLFPASWQKCDDLSKSVLAQVMAAHPCEGIVPTLNAGLKSPSAAVRAASAAAFAGYTDNKLAEMLLKFYPTEKEATVKAAALGSIFKIAAASSPDPLDTGVKIFKAVDEADRVMVGEFLLGSTGLAGFKAIESLFADPKYGASAKKVYVGMYDSIVAKAGQPGAELDPKRWTGNANRNGHEFDRAFDRNEGSRWGGGSTPEIGDWITLGLGETAFISDLVLDSAKSKGDEIPAGEVYLSNDGENWLGPLAKFDEKNTVDGVTTVKLNAPGKFIKVVATKFRGGKWWSIHEIHVRTGIDKELLEGLSKTVEGLKK